jgi:mono/diheme cytochrome c family protein
VLWLLMACDDNAVDVGGFGVEPYPNYGGGGGSISGDTWPDVQAVLYNNCGECHTGSTGTGGFDLVERSCVELSREFAYGHPLIATDHTESTIWHKIEGDDPATYGGIMPPTGKMSSAAINTIADWMDAGAVCPTTSYEFSAVQTVFDSHCVTCHTDGGAGAPLDLTQGASALVSGDSGIPSRYETGGLLVDRGNPGDSFLLRKLQGTLASDGSEGERMPLDGERLSTDEIALIYGWILDGARP